MSIEQARKRRGGEKSDRHGTGKSTEALRRPPRRRLRAAHRERQVARGRIRRRRWAPRHDARSQRRTRAARRGALVAPGPSRTHSSASRSPAAGMLERLFVLACSPRTSVSCGLIYATLEQYSRTNDSVFTSIRSGDGVLFGYWHHIQMTYCLFRCADGVHSTLGRQTPQES